MYVYKITNIINNKVYIGITKDIAQRFSYHKRDRSKEGCKEYDKPLYRAIRKYGLDNFEFSILEDGLTLDEANDKEIYYIKKYNSLTHYNGYNIGPGGNLAPTTIIGENNYNSKLTTEEVLDIISKRDIEGLRPIKVYQLFKDKIAYDTFEHIWLGNNWKHLQPDTIEFKSHEYNNGEDVYNTNLTNEDVADIIVRRDAGRELQKDIYNDYKHLIKFSGFSDIWIGRSWKHLQPIIIPKRPHGRAHLTSEQVREIRTLKGTNTYSSLGLKYGVPSSTISNIINYKTYKNVT